MEWRLVPKKKPPGLSKEAEKPAKKAAPKSAAITPTPIYGKPGNPHDQFIADLIQGLQDGTILLRSIDARRVTSHPYTELMVELLDTGLPPGVLPSAVAAHTGVKAPTGPTGATGAVGVTGATGPAPVQVHHIGHSAVTAVGGPVSSSAVSMTAVGGMVGKVAALPGAKSYGLKQSKSEEPIVGYRDFKLTQGGMGYFLQSRNGAVWPHRKKMTALCGGNPFASHEVPEPSCACGIYAYAKPDDSALQRDNSFLWGEIAMWGEVLVCESGYRAEFAYPTALFMRKPLHTPGNERRGFLRRRARS